MLQNHTENKNLSILAGNDYMGMPVYQSEPLAESYLNAINNTITRALNEHPRTLAVRFDLHLPKIVNDPDYPQDLHNTLITRFIESFKAKHKAAEVRKAREGKRVYKSNVRFIWARERNDADQDHWHVMLFLNNDAFNSLGSYQQFGDNNLTRIIEAWGSVTGLDSFSARNLVHIPQNPLYFLKANSPNFLSVVDDVFFRASYFAKLTTKHYGNGSGNAFGSSRS